MADVINGYECVLNGEMKGVKYLVDLIETNHITDDEIFYLVHIAAEIIERRQTPELSLVPCYSG
ncbi:MAG: hypothetical protein CMN56_15665 [Sneathiella sp.]|uniref:hypothetical protein n=1 Tax=Sneathiella sp. TaxID=1964365 RepID=UPI000C600371|nr:hypothetical protein [Sneathiella sp.]MAZ04571.1 hypothetical protein [Sneathiella sp.]|tara:strand:- start:267 stop:458 length:192 start_codon:yes stop_codon:yes gene_type:complete